MLYDLDYESCPLDIIQGLLLMTLWPETVENEKDAWHWMGVAISLALRIGLNTWPNTASGRDLSHKKLRRRLWWCCLVREQYLALEMNRPSRIQAEDCEIPMLKEDDFDFQHLPDEIGYIFDDDGIMGDLRMQHELSTIFISKIWLCSSINQLVQARQDVSSCSAETKLSRSHDGLGNIELLRGIDNGLMDWAESLPSCCCFRTLSMWDIEVGSLTIAMQRTLLHLTYHAVTYFLHHVQCLFSMEARQSDASQQLQHLSRLRMREAVMHMTRIVGDLHHLNLEQFLPLTDTTIALSAIRTHLIGVEHGGDQSNSSRDSQRNLDGMDKLSASSSTCCGLDNG